MLHGQVKVITANEPELFEQRLNAFLDSLNANSAIVNIQYVETVRNNDLYRTAYVHHKKLESEW
ncbi:hypothetical protein [Deinococcus peraridilitoris]|uniref:Uncharacterized protein n=1 Tax=Deinococcus peraridilitoris (strain DSM 19664 / LMG 22246 / CIP 109416 / KR-200) TaxID=937777 RepID=K9ZY66_DEIPD|nr:hypothetical protein [Deinococcus peraridilitoris]AFZ66588.1 hypothetical protein Deipe_1024 [Deinococcus peraridilitoris DSM 19664]